METIWLATLGGIPVYPLIGATLAMLWSPGLLKNTGPRPAGYLNIVLTALAFIQSLIGLVTLWGQPAIHLSFDWVRVADLQIQIPIQFSAVTVGACVLITGLNLMAQIYAVGYLEMDWGWARFFALMSVFEAGMCALVLVDSLFFSYVILELLTLGTYLLVGFWYNQARVVTGARDAFLTKRVGDLALLIGVFALYPLAGTWNFDQLADWATNFEGDPVLITWVGLALLAGPLGKCAQFPLHLWLDEAMEGPVPATILRNSVVVGAGAWVMIRLAPVLSLSPVVLTVAVLIGVISGLGGSLVSVAQVDAKRVVSYLTTAWLGLVFVAVGTGYAETARLMLFAGAAGMALLVMAVGAVSWNTITQDLRQLGGLWSRRPISGLGVLVGGLALVGLPPLGMGWVLSDWLTDLWPSRPGVVLVVLGINAVMAFSVMRLFGTMFAGAVKPMSARAPEVFWPMALPMVVVLGVVLHTPQLLLLTGLVPSWSGSLIGSTVIGVGLGWWFYGRQQRISWDDLEQLTPLRKLLSEDFYTQQTYQNTVIAGVRSLSWLIEHVDRWFVDGLAQVIALGSLATGQLLRYSTSGQSQLYILASLFGLVMAGWVIWWQVQV